jgi:hypothetical protein
MYVSETKNKALTFETTFFFYYSKQFLNLFFNVTDFIFDVADNSVGHSADIPK